MNTKISKLIESLGEGDSVFLVSSQEDVAEQLAEEILKSESLMQKYAVRRDGTNYLFSRKEIICPVKVSTTFVRDISEQYSGMVDTFMQNGSNTIWLNTDSPLAFYALLIENFDNKKIGVDWQGWHVVFYKR